MPRLVVDFLPGAVEEGRAARDYYLSKSERIEEESRRELEHAIELIAERPDTWPRYLHGTRRFIMRRFPYAVVYRREPAAVLVVAIAHGSRKPGYWRHRTP